MRSTQRIHLDQDGTRYSYFRSSRARVFRFAALLFAVIAALSSGGVAAQTAPPSLADQQELRERAEREARQRTERQAVPDAGQPSADRTATYLHTDLPSEAPCFRIGALRLQGEGVGRFDWIQRYLNQYPRKCIGQERIGFGTGIVLSNCAESRVMSAVAPANSEFGARFDASRRPALPISGVA